MYTKKAILVSIFLVVVMLVTALLCLPLIQGSMALAAPEQRYQITFDNNGGTAPEDLHDAYYYQPNDGLLFTSENGAENVNAPVPSYLGYTFLGWYLGEDIVFNANGERVSFADIFTATTLVALWQADTITVSFDANGGSDVEAVSLSYHSEVLSFTSPQKVGWVFEGWCLGSQSTVIVLPNGSFVNNVDASYVVEGKWIYRNDVTLKALWSKNITYAVTLDYRDGVTPVGTFFAKQGSNSVFVDNPAETVGSFPTATRVGYNFLGWYSQAEGGVLVARGGQSTWHDSGIVEGYTQNGIWMSETATVYARWSGVVYAVTLDYNDGISDTGTVYAKFGSSAVYADSTAATYAQPFKPERVGSIFLGWYTSVDGGLKVSDGEGEVLENVPGRWSDIGTVAGYTTQGVWSNAGTAVLYAVWTPLLPATVFGQGSFIGIENGGVQVLRVAATHQYLADTLSYSWYKGTVSGNSALNCSEPTLNVSKVLDSGVYFCVVSVSTGNQTSSTQVSFSVEIKPLALRTQDSMVEAMLEDAEGFPSASQFIVSKTDGAGIAVPKGVSAVGFYHAKLLVGDQLLQPDAAVTVSLKLTEDIDPTGLFAVVFVDGQAVEKPVLVKDGFAIFETEVLGDFVLSYHKPDLLWLVISAPIVGAIAISAIVCWMIINRNKRRQTK